MLGTIVNTIAILVGGFVGLLLRGGIPQKYKTIVTQATGLSVLALGLAGAISKINEPEANPILFIVSLVVGGLLGEWLGIEAGLEKLGNWLQGKLRTKKEYGSISTGFVAASLMFCVGTMAVLGALESGMQNQHTTLFAKSTLDGITAIVMASSLGMGVLFSSISVFLYQGAITLLAGAISPFLSAAMLREIALVGGVMIAALGLNMLGITKIKVGNMLPAILVPVVYYLVIGLL